MQKVVSIYLDSQSQAAESGKKGPWYQPPTTPHGTVQEHLEEYLRAGWQVVSITGFGGSRQFTVGGWAIVVLEMPEEESRY